MRIRKNAKLSSLLRSQASPPDAPFPSSHVCLLNQSPWDVLPFSFPDALPQLDGGEDSFTANGSFGDSIGAVESVASMMAVDAEEKTVIVNELEGRAFYDFNNEDRMNISSYGAKNGGGSDGDFGLKVCCNKTDGKRWQCKKEAVDGHHLCEHHLSQLKSYATTTTTADYDYDDHNAANADDSASRKLDRSSASTGRRGGRPRGAKKNSSSSAAAAAGAANSNQFYYYSGFGPSWAKRRSGRAGDQPRRPEGRAGGSPQPTPPRIGGGGGIDYVDYDMEEDEEEEDDHDDDGDSGKKRMRKPVKARSLKSLM
ncbi:uncharacterized protein LOC104443423 isoform X2 [Eucalyptus grandis]|uniref:uncharacterized protein LOC104443423 isoform X2 n=1 Tax=Eucalyptus grandis TaxID=71139 RepID=UPI0005245792|nr:uncharacterized protein LOC104443423 isoform X2 [Eucalyptus grandis]